MICSSQKVEFLREIASFLPLKFEYANYFQFKDFYAAFMILQSIGFKFFAKIMKRSCVFYCSSCISFKTTSHLKVNKSVYIAKSRQRYHKTLNNILLHVPNHT